MACFLLELQNRVLKYGFTLYLIPAIFKTGVWADAHSRNYKELYQFAGFWTDLGSVLVFSCFHHCPLLLSLKVFWIRTLPWVFKISQLEWVWSSRLPAQAELTPQWPESLAPHSVWHLMVGYYGRQRGPGTCWLGIPHASSYTRPSLEKLGTAQVRADWAVVLI